jgi:hypothetical protein
LLCYAVYVQEVQNVYRIFSFMFSLSLFLMYIYMILFACIQDTVLFWGYQDYRWVPLRPASLSCIEVTGASVEFGLIDNRTYTLSPSCCGLTVPIPGGP